MQEGLPRSSTTRGSNYTPTIIGHRPHCALSALERFAEFPRQERLDSLRPHLVRYQLFPLKSDPETAPITMRELKGLVRIWKLHNERNFWRKNSTKDAIVLALHQHMHKTRQLERLKQEIVAKGRQKREEERAQQIQPVHTFARHRRSFDNVPSETTSPVEIDKLAKTSHSRRSKANLPNISESLESKKEEVYVPAHEREPTPENPNDDSGMIYLSRGFAGSSQRIDPRTPPNLQVPTTRSMSDGDLQRSNARAIVDSTDAGSQSGTSLSQKHLADQLAVLEKGLLVKRKCSTALLNMSTNEVMQAQFIEQGGLSALLELAASNGDNEVMLNCAACLVNLIQHGDYYEPVRLLDAGVVRVLVRMVHGQEPLVRHCCALCLCRLSAELGIEERLISDGALSAATKLVQSSDMLITKVVAAKVLINLALTLEGNQAESLVKNMLKCVGNLIGHSQCDCTTQEFCAKAIANLACLSVARPILAKQGVVATLKMLLATAVSTATTDACTAALCNMGQLHSCRKEMLSLGLIRTMNSLLRSGPQETQHLCTLCLTTLSFQKDLRSALLREGALRTIASVVSKRTHPDLTRQGACALLNFAFDPQTREDVISEDGLLALMALLDMDGDSSTVDEETRANSLMAVCNLLADQATCPHVVEAGVLPRLAKYTVHLSRMPGLHDYLSVALLNMSIHAEMRKNMVQTVGCVNLLLELAILKKSLNAAQLEHWVHTSDTLSTPIEHAQPRAPTAVSTNARFTTIAEPSCAKKALKALFNLCMDPVSHSVIINEKLIDSIHVLNNLYDFPPSNPGVHEPTRPGSRKKRERFLNTDIAQVPTDDESLLHLSAMLIHVLSTNKENHSPLLEGGVVALLVKISGSPNEKTKTAVAGSLYNLTQCAQVTNEEFLTALMALSHTNENVRVLWCAWCFANVSTYPKGRVMLGKLSKKFIPTLLAMMRSGCADAERIQYAPAFFLPPFWHQPRCHRYHCSVAMCNTLSVYLSKEDVHRMITDGTVQDVIVITVLRANDVQTKQVLAQALFNLLAREDTRSALIKQDVPLALLRLTNKADSILNLLCVKVFLNLSCEGSAMAPKLLEMKVVRNMVEQCLSPSGGIQIKRMCAKTLSNLSRTPEMLGGLAAGPSKIVAGIRSMSVVQDAETLEDLASIAYHLSTVVDGRTSLIKQDVVPVITSLCVGESSARVQQLVVAAIGNLSCCAEAHRSITESAMPLLIETMRQTVRTLDTRINACIALCNLVVRYPASREIAIRGDVLPALRHFVRAVSTDEAMVLMAKVLRDLTWQSDGQPILASQGAMALCLRLAKNEQVILKHDVATAVCNLCSCPFATANIVEEGAINAIFWLTLQDCLNMTRPILRECAIAVRHLAQNDSLRPLICMEDNLLPVMVRLSRFMECEEIRYDAAVTIYYILGNEPTQKSICRAGAIKLLSDLATTGTSIREVCSAALHQLPNELLSNINGQLLSVLMSLLQMSNAEFTDPNNFKADRSCASKHPWELKPAKYTYSKEIPKAQWPTSVICRSTSTFVAANYSLEPFLGEQVNPCKARRTNDLIGQYSKMLHSCSQLNNKNLHAAYGDTYNLKSTQNFDSERADKKVYPQGERRSDDCVTAPSPASPTPDDCAGGPNTPPPGMRTKSDLRSEIGAPRVEDNRLDLKTFPSISDTTHNVLSTPAIEASDALRRATVASAFKSNPHSCRQLYASETRLRHQKQASTLGAKSGQMKAIRRKYASSKSSQQLSRLHTALRARQQDRIADDYYELLRYVLKA